MKTITYVLFVVILTSYNLLCFAFLIPNHNVSLIRNKRQSPECRGKFVCYSGTECIGVSQVCNRIKDCQDGSDEEISQCTKLKVQTGNSCLPLLVENGKFTIVGKDYEKGILIPNYSRIEITCNPNFTLYSNDSFLTCYSGVWDKPLPKCKLNCPPRISTSAQVNCTLNDKAVDCNEPMTEGTISISTCKNFYTPTFSSISISTCIDGYWDNPLIQCEPDCGEVIPDGIALLTSGEDTKRGEFPWTVGIYRLINKEYFLLCGGNIITPTMVLTVAHCVAKNPPEEYFIGAGKYYSEYNNQRDVLAQKRQVKEFYIPTNFKGKDNNYMSDIAVAVIKTPFEITNVVRPVCIDWENKYGAKHLKHNNLGNIAGWGYIESGNMSPYLKQLKIPYIDTEQCLKDFPQNFRKYVTPDKYCAGYINGSSACAGDSGNGMVFEETIKNKQKMFIQGILSVGPSGVSRCEAQQRAAYTRVSNYLDFIKNVTQKEEYFCQPRTSYKVDIQCTLNGEKINCSEPMKHGTVAISDCKENYMLSYIQNNTATCNNGFWDNPPLKCELRGQNRFLTPDCSPIISDSTNVKCLLNDNPVDCYQYLKEGTIAISECKRFYTPKKNQNSVYVSVCSGGAWTSPPIQCEPIQPIEIECGEVVSKGEIHSINTITSKIGEFPWHVGVYKNLETYYRYTCGGSIITANIILTAAHCLTDQYGKRFPAEEYFIAAGKYYSDYNAQEDKLSQKRQVKEYHMPSIYKGYETNFAGDIAVVVVKQPFELNTVIQPVCIEWDDKIESQQLKPNNRGSVVGWGSVDPFDEKRISRELKQFNAPYVGVTQCLKDVPLNFRRWVTTDKFCAGYTNGSSVCKGDSGGGMVFEWTTNHTQKYFIRGIVSVGPSDTKKSLICDNFKYSAYTKVSFYTTFILDIIKKYHD